MYSLDDLFLFIRVVDVGSFVHTAKALKISETTVSRRIKNLERQMGISLLSVNTKNFELTDYGRQVYNEIKERYEPVNGLIESIENIIEHKKEPIGTLNIVLPVVMSLELISPHIPKFISKYPKISLNIQYQNKEVDMIKDGVDIAILNHMPRQQTQKIRNVYSVYFKLYCSKAYAHKYGLPKTPDDLAKHLVVGYILDDGTIPNNVAITNIKTEQITITSMPRRITTNNGLHSIKWVLSNEMICPLLESSISSIQEGIIEVLPEYQLYKMEYYLLRHPHSNSLNIQLFCDFLEKCLKETT